MPTTDPLRDLGVTLTADGGTIRVYSAHASTIELCLFSRKDPNWVTDTVPLQKGDGDVWSASSSKLRAGRNYTLRATGPDGSSPSRFDPSLHLIDPYARGLSKSTSGQWRSSILDDHFDWGGVAKPATPIDHTIINVAMPRLVGDLGATASQLQWIVAAYTIVFAGLLLTAGSIGDRFGRRHALLAGLATFLGGSVVAATAGSTMALIAGRCVMGVGGALIMPTTLSILVNVFGDPRERAKAIAGWTAASGAAVSCARCSGEAISSTTSGCCSRRYSATCCAIACPRGDKPNPGSRPYRTPFGLCTSPCRRRWTTVLWEAMGPSSQMHSRTWQSPLPATFAAGP